MALTFKAKGGGGDFKSCPSGSHIAVCNLVADLGLQPGSQAYPDPKHKVYIRFEIADERVQYERDGKKFDLPVVIGQAFTASMHEKANLRKQLEGWRGRKFTDDEAEVFDVSAILGKPCMLNVVENRVGEKIYSNIASISPVPRSVQAPNAENALLYYADESKDCFESLPEWLREKITNQVRLQASHASGTYANSPSYEHTDTVPLEAYESTFITDEDIPF